MTLRFRDYLEDDIGYYQNYLNVMLTLLFYRECTMDTTKSTTTKIKPTTAEYSTTTAGITSESSVQLSHSTLQLTLSSVK